MAYVPRRQRLVLPTNQHRASGLGTWQNQANRKRWMMGLPLNTVATPSYGRSMTPAGQYSIGGAAAGQGGVAPGRRTGYGYRMRLPGGTIGTVAARVVPEDLSAEAMFERYRQQQALDRAGRPV